MARSAVSHLARKQLRAQERAAARAEAKAVAESKDEPRVEPNRQQAELTYADTLNLEDHMDQMLRNGRCGHQVRYLAQKFDRITFCELAKVESGAERQVNHADCRNADSCIAHNVDMTSYSTAHRTPSCGCTNLKVPYDALVALIEKGEVPLFSIEHADDPQTCTTLRLHKRTARSEYVAISHVWADGLGNPSENSAPKCQLEYLATQFKAIYGTTNKLFWFDTLCIPVKDEDEHLRSKAIDTMASIYACSDLVLVLDRELMGSKITTIDQCFAQIICSVWMCRSWTLQEGILAEKCAFQFSDATFIMNLLETGHQMRWRLIQDVYEDEDSERRSAFESSSSLTNAPLPEPTSDPEARRAANKTLATTRMLRKLGHFFAVEFFGVRRTRLLPHERFTFVWNELARRSTTKPEDRLLILANLLGFSAQQLHAISPGKRLPTMIFSLDKIPFALFLQCHSEINHGLSHSDRWAPSELSAQMLTQCPLLLKKEGQSLTFINHRPWLPDSVPWHSELSFFVVNEVIPLTAGRVAIRPSQKDALFAFHYDSTNNMMRRSDLPRFLGTCFVAQNENSASASHDRGVVFYVTESSPKRLSLCFCSTATVERISLDTADTTTIPFRNAILATHPIINIHHGPFHSNNTASARSELLPSLTVTSIDLSELEDGTDQVSSFIAAVATVVITVYGYSRLPVWFILKCILILFNFLALNIALSQVLKRPMRAHYNWRRMCRLRLDRGYGTMAGTLDGS